MHRLSIVATPDGMYPVEAVEVADGAVSVNLMCSECGYYGAILLDPWYLGESPNVGVQVTKDGLYDI